MNNRQKKIIKLSDEILTYLLKFKEKHPDFTFSLRKRDSVQSKDKRLVNGQWFQGSHYIYVPLFKKGDSARKIKTVGFVIGIQEDGNMNNYIEISFKSGIDDPKEKEFHKQLANRIDLQLHEKNHGTKAFSDQNDIWNNLLEYITNFRNYAIELLDNLDLKAKYVISENDFQKDLNRIKLIQTKLMNPVDSEITLKREEGLENNNEMLNQIFYGPPGTGKTYHTINEAIFIIDPQFDFYQSRKKIKDKFEELVSSGQIVFTTFHQSMSYEDFIEGIKPIAPTSENSSINYKIENGIFKNLCKKATEKKASVNFDEAYSLFVNDVIESGTIELTSLVQKKPFTVRINSNETAVAIPKTEIATEMGVTKEMMRDYVINGVVKDWKTYTTTIGEYLKSKYNISVQNIDNTKKNYVLIIDEINRGNISQIFGELITLIEEDKRLGKKEALEVTLPYSKEKFGVPSNLYIIGTMNTADRSVEALDTALRRRFSFEEMMPMHELLSPSALYCQLLWDYESADWEDPEFKEKEVQFFDFAQVSEDFLAQRKEIWEVMKADYIRDDFSYFDDFEYNGFNLQVILEKINKRIEILLNRDHLIGHSYFLKVRTEEQLKATFKNNIIPLLQEYFYGDYEKIGLILGNGFFEQSGKYSKDIFASFDTQNYPDNGTILRIKTIDEDFDIVAAVNILLKV